MSQLIKAAKLKTTDVLPAATPQLGAHAENEGFWLAAWWVKHGE